MATVEPTFTCRFSKSKQSFFFIPFHSGWIFSGKLPHPKIHEFFRIRHDVVVVVVVVVVFVVVGFMKFLAFVILMVFLFLLSSSLYFVIVVMLYPIRIVIMTRFHRKCQKTIRNVEKWRRIRWEGLSASVVYKKSQTFSFDFSKNTKSEVVSMSTFEKKSISKIKAKLISYVS